MTGPLLDHLWQSTLCVGLVWALVRALRGAPARVRFGLWFAASLKFLLPFSLLVDIGRLWAATAPTRDSALIAAPVQFAVRIAAPFAGATPRIPIPRSTLPDLLTLGLCVWSAGTVAVLATWAVRWWHLRRLRRSARPVPLAAPVPVLAHRSAREPGVCGLWRPVLLLPEGLAGRLSIAETRAVLAHELCHIRRRDNLLAAIHMLVEALFWFHPLTWWVGSRLLEERERACDEWVVRCGTDAHTYAEGILKVCRFYVESTLPCAAGISGPDLPGRIDAIIRGDPAGPSTPSQRRLLAAAAMAAIAAPVLSGMLALPDSVAAALANFRQQLYEQARPRTAVPMTPAQFDRYAGYYEFPPITLLHLFRDGTRLEVQHTGQRAVEIYPDSASEFFSKVIPVELSFLTDAGGAVTALVVHEQGVDQVATRISEATARGLQAALQQRIRTATPSPGTQAALRRFVGSLELGHTDYGILQPPFDTFMRFQPPPWRAVIQKLGALRSLQFKGVGQNGWDIYVATFAHGSMQWRVAPLSASGRITGLGTNPLGEIHP